MFETITTFDALKYYLYNLNVYCFSLCIIAEQKDD